MSSFIILFAENNYIILYSPTTLWVNFYPVTKTPKENARPSAMYLGEKKNNDLKFENNYRIFIPEGTEGGPIVFTLRIILC